MDNLTDITKVCKMLGTTSRALRFYEQKGIIVSTKLPYTNRRAYSEMQLERIKRVLVLRSLGMPVAEIKKLTDEKGDLHAAVVKRKARLIAVLTEKARELNLLEETLAAIENGEDIFIDKNNTARVDKAACLTMKTAAACTDAFIHGEYERCFALFSDTLREYVPLDSFKRISTDTLAPLGGYVAVEKTSAEEKDGNIVYSYIKYENLGLCIKYVFRADMIYGIWLSYYRG